MIYLLEFYSLDWRLRLIDHKRLLELVSCDADTGLFTRRVSIGQRSRAGSIAKALDKGDGYMRVCVGGLMFNYARLVWFYFHKEWPRHEIDHINGNRSDNRLINLRIATRAQNMQARKEYRTPKSGFRGVAKTSRGLYQAQISVNGKKRHIGIFVTADEAHQAWLREAKNIRGEYFCSN